MLYLSESEAPLTTAVWEDVADAGALTEKITKLNDGDADLQELTADAFLAKIHRSVDVADEGMVAYGKQYDALFALLRQLLQDIRVFITGGKVAQVFITGFHGSCCYAISTQAVQT